MTNDQFERLNQLIEACRQQQFAHGHSNLAVVMWMQAIEKGKGVPVPEIKNEDDDSVKPLTSDQRLSDLTREARAAYDSLTDDEQKTFRRAQKISWVHGEMRLAGHEISREEIAAILDGLEGE